MEILNLDPAMVAIFGAVIAGVTELLNRLRAKDYWVAATILTSALVGVGLAAYYSIDLLTGALAGFFASGAITTVGALGNKSTPTKSDVLSKEQ